MKLFFSSETVSADGFYPPAALNSVNLRRLFLRDTSEVFLPEATETEACLF